MMIFRNVRRTFQRRFFQLMGIAVLVLASSTLFTTFSYAMDGIKDPTFSFFEESNLEDFSIDTYPVLMQDEFIKVMTECQITEYIDLQTLYQISPDCYNEVIQDRMELIESDYDVQLEQRLIKNVLDQGTRYLIFNEMTTINKTYYDEGRAPGDGEVALTPTYARKNNISIGDQVTILGSSYTVSGFALIPDYNLPIIGTSFSLDNAKQTFVRMTEEDYNKVQFDSLVTYYSGIGSEEEIKRFEEEADYDFVLGITDTVNQMRSGAIELELKAGRVLSVGISLIMATFSLVVVGIIVNRMIARERNQLGLLKSLGYTKTEITMPYLILLGLLSLPMLGLGYWIGFSLATPAMNFFTSFYLLPFVELPHSLDLILMSIIIPFVFIMVMAFVVIRFLLRKTPLEMMNPKVITVSGYIKVFDRFTKKMDSLKKFKYSMIFQAMDKFIVFAIGIWFAVFMLTFGFSFSNMMDAMINDYYDNVNYEYEGYCDYTGCPEDLDATYTLELSGKMNDEAIVLTGIDSDSSLNIAYNKQFEPLNTELHDDSVVVSRQLAKQLSIDIDDSITIEVNDQTIGLIVVDIAENYMGNVIYMNLSDMHEILNVDYTNKVYSTNPLIEEDFYSVVSKTDLKDQALSMSEYTEFMSILFVGFSILVGFIILYLIIGITIEENYYTISLLKVLGLNKREVNKLVLNPYMGYTIGIYLISIPVVLGLMNLMEIIFLRYYNLVFPFEVTYYHWGFGFLSVLFMYFIGTLDAKRKINSISLQESLKLYQE